MNDKQIEVAKLNNFIKTSAKAKTLDTNEISDGYHTFGELYEHRIALFIALCSQLNAAADETGRDTVVWKSKLHHDGTALDGWFIMGIFTEKGKQITYHLPLSYWDQLDWIETLENAPEWDGHTPADVVRRVVEL